ncbi:MAG TPA: alpha/beta hydrolase-fold protein, partial [Myxococcaceae bacterium]|nr:alpha/beta hydrolase-fold protein [Myxococcaceae bacterium]
MVLAFHGAFSSGVVMRADLGIEAPAVTPTIFVYPDAVRGTWDVGPRSLDGRLVETLLGRLAETYCIDPARISIAGFSAGAVFTLWLGCNVPDSFHAMAVVAGTSSRFDGRCCKRTIS